MAEVKQEERRGDTFGELAERYIVGYAEVKNKPGTLREKKGVIKMDLCSHQGAEPKITRRIRGASQKSRRRCWENGVSAPERVGACCSGRELGSATSRLTIKTQSFFLELV